MTRPLVTKAQLLAYLDTLTPERREDFLKTLRQALAQVPRICEVVERCQADGISQAEQYANEATP